MQKPIHPALVELTPREAAQTGGGQSADPPDGGVLTSLIRLLGAFGGGE